MDVNEQKGIDLIPINRPVKRRNNSNYIRIREINKTKFIDNRSQRRYVSKRRGIRGFLKGLKGAGIAVGIGTIIVGTVIGPDGLYDIFHDNKETVSVPVDTNDESYAIDTTVEDLSGLNVVLVNDGICDEQIEEAERSLEATGLSVDVRDINELNKDGTECFIALTNYRGDRCKVIGNYNNGNNAADLLAIGMKEGFGGNIQKGVYDKGNAEPTLILSDIEKAVDDQTIPTVTIAVPEEADLEDYSSDGSVRVDTSFTNNFTDSVLEGLARYNDSLKYVDINDGKFLLRPNQFNNPADYEKSLNSDVLRLNDLEDSYFIRDDRILLNRGLPKSFDKVADVQISVNQIKNKEL